ncbi:MAG: AMP-binding protein, partial [Algicola sp.]|nr:AMP-binding protein [Algicola sp.]
MQNAFPHLCNDRTLPDNKVALVEGDKCFTYREVNQRIDRVATGLLAGKADLHTDVLSRAMQGAIADLNEERIAFFMPASLDYVTTMHGVWRAGGIAVPLNVASAVVELEHYLSSASVTRLIASPEYHESLICLCESLTIDLYCLDDVIADEVGALPQIDPNRRAMMLFTSGTTNKPKGVVSTHKTLHAQITTLIDAWAWTQ